MLEPGQGRRAPGRLLASVGPGYLLQVRRDQVDAIAFDDQLAAARRARAAGELAAASLLEAALGLRQGEPLAGSHPA